MADVSGVRVAGPLGPFVAGFAVELSRQGYKPQPVGKQLGLAAEGVAASGLSSEVAEALLRGASRGWAHRSGDGPGADSAAGIPARTRCRAAGEHAGARGPGRGTAGLLSSVSGAGARPGARRCPWLRGQGAPVCGAL